MKKKKKNLGEKIAIHTIWIENELNIRVFFQMLIQMIHIRYMCKTS